MKARACSRNSASNLNTMRAWRGAVFTFERRLAELLAGAVVLFTLPCFVQCAAGGWRAPSGSVSRGALRCPVCMFFETRGTAGRFVKGMWSSAVVRKCSGWLHVVCAWRTGAAASPARKEAPRCDAHAAHRRLPSLSLAAWYVPLRPPCHPSSTRAYCVISYSTCDAEGLRWCERTVTPRGRACLIAVLARRVVHAAPAVRERCACSSAWMSSHGCVFMRGARRCRGAALRRGHARQSRGDATACAVHTSMRRLREGASPDQRSQHVLGSAACRRSAGGTRWPPLRRRARAAAVRGCRAARQHAGTWQRRTSDEILCVHDNNNKCATAAACNTGRKRAAAAGRKVHLRCPCVHLCKCILKNLWRTLLCALARAVSGSQKCTCKKKPPTEVATG
jgi:hypothetical protein